MEEHLKDPGTDRTDYGHEISLGVEVVGLVVACKHIQTYQIYMFTLTL